LVPFGEFVPTGFRWFVDALGIPMADQLRGPVGGDSFDVAGIQAAGGICYENMFGEELRHAWDKANPGFILNTANLGWFTDAVLPQFTAMSAMRARETARPLIQAVQNAHSALIGPDGKTQRLASKGAQNLDMTVVTATGSPTPFVRYGHWALIGLLVVLLAGCLTLAFRVVCRQQA
jgi:apolipoprotein N-acyltransferase